MPERFPLALNNLNAVRNATPGVGPLFDLLALRTRDYIYFFDDFLGPALDTTNKYSTDVSDAASAAVVSAGLGGRVALVTGVTNAAHSCLYIATSTFTGDIDAIISARVQINTITTVKVEIGFSNDPTVDDGVINSLDAGSAPTLRAGITDCVCAIFDTASARANWQFAGARASTAWRDATLNAAAGAGITHPTPTAATYQWITVALRRSERGAIDQMSAAFYVDGVLKAEKVDGAIDGTVAIYPYLTIYNNSGITHTLTVDALEVIALRDINA